MKSVPLKIVVYALVTYTACQILEVTAIDSNGLGDHIDWQPWAKGLSLAKETGKPLMLILHKSWCGACKSLKPKFEASKEIGELSSQFVMINAKEGDEPENDPKFNIDGGYVPRIFFLDSNGNVLSNVIHEGGNPTYKYFYSRPEGIVNSMKRALEIVKTDKKKINVEL